MADELTGKTIGRFYIERLLGRGGMGAVYEGTDPETKQRVAIKVMMRNLGEDAESISRFEREANLAAQIQHDNVAAVIDSGTQDDIRYLVMEFIDGRSVGEFIREKGHIAGRRCLDFIRQTAAGLQAANERGIIHRDIKPENLMVTQNDIVKVVDFGLAKSATAADSFKTATGTVMGTPHYMSPEQASGRPVDHRSDIYSLGASFYHMLTGHTPFNGENAFQILQKHVHQEPPALQKWNPNIPEPVSQVVYRMMAKHPDERFQTYQHLISVLDDVIHGRNSPSLTMDVVDKEPSIPQFVPRALEPVRNGNARLVKIGAAVLAVVVFGLGVHYIKNEFFSTPPMPDPSALQGKQDIFETGKASFDHFKNDTVPMIGQIRQATREQDEESRNFGSRRERENAN